MMSEKEQQSPTGAEETNLSSEAGIAENLETDLSPEVIEELENISSALEAEVASEDEEKAETVPEEEQDPTLTIADLEQQVAELTEEVARQRAERYRLNQEYTAYVKRSKAEAKRGKEEGQKTVLQLLLPVLDDIYAARKAEELSGPFAAIVTKLENTLATNCGLNLFGEVGEEFDPNCHEALLAQTNTEVEKPQIAQVLQPGYKLGEEVLRATKVIVDNPE